MVVGRGLNSSSLSLATNSLGSIYAFGVDVPRLSVTASG